MVIRKEPLKQIAFPICMDWPDLSDSWMQRENTTLDLLLSWSNAPIAGIIFLSLDDSFDKSLIFVSKLCFLLPSDVHESEW